MERERPETLRELGTLESPRKGEISWDITEPIRTHGQLSVAKAVKKRLKRGIKRVEDNSIMKVQLEHVQSAIADWNENHYIYDQVQKLKEMVKGDGDKTDK